jgi:tetratricopeptide (TPR) repeat protein
VADNQRIEDLRRRVQKDPASIAFAQLAEECRRAGQVEEAVEVCRAGLAIHPGYLSARVTLGRALIEMNDLDQALQELTVVLKSAPENLAAIRGIAEIHHRRGELAEALTQYRAALALARNDPDLQQTVAELVRQVEPAAPPAADEGLSFEQLTNEFLKMGPPPTPPIQPAPPPVEEAAPAFVEPSAAPVETADLVAAPSEATPIAPVDLETPASFDAGPSFEPVHSFEPPQSSEPAQLVEPAQSFEPVQSFEPRPTVEPVPTELERPLAPWSMPAEITPSPALEPEYHAAWSEPSTLDDSGAREEAMRTIAALEQWLDAIHVARAHRSP